MKKLDFLIIGITIFLILAISIPFLVKKERNNDQVQIEVLYKSKLVSSISLEEDAIYSIQVNNNELIFKKNDEVIKKINVDGDNSFNSFEIKNQKVKMIDADCKGKDCEKMYITINHLIPIICTNGVVLNPTSSSNIDVIV